MKLLITCTLILCLLCDTTVSFSLTSKRCVLNSFRLPSRNVLRCTEVSVDGYPTFPKELNYLNLETAKKILPWASFGGICWMFKSFYPIVVGTFFLSVMGNSIVDSIGVFFQNLSDRIKVPRLKKIPRKLLATLYFIFLGFGLTRFLLIVSPRIVKESTYVIQVLQSEDPYYLTANLLLKTFGSEMAARLESVMIAAVGVGASGTSLVGLDQTRRLGKLIQNSVMGYLQNLLLFSSKIISNSTTAAYKGVLSLIFSLMIVWDLPRITDGVKALENSAIRFAYKEVAPPVKAFGFLVAQCFETQAVIALVNCVLTTLGLYTLKISGLGFFSLLTFVASFIPVAGIFIATLPPLICAFTEHGLVTCVKLIAMVAGVHAVEAYLLYPQIYAYRLKLHPLIVLSALVTAEHFAGVQGLFLAMPITLYLLKQVIFPEAKAIKKLEPVQQPTSLFSKS